MKSTSDKIKESILIDLNPEQHFIPGVWGTLYREAYRNNHIIFTEQELESFAQSLHTPSHEALSAPERKQLIHVSYLIFTASSLAEIRTYLSQLNEAQKVFFFDIYRLKLQQWRQKIKSSLH